MCTFKNLENFLKKRVATLINSSNILIEKLTVFIFTHSFTIDLVNNIFFILN